MVDQVENVRMIYNCDECSHFSIGFLSEPNECGYFKKPYEYFVRGRGIPKWCPLRNVNIGGVIAVAVVNAAACSAELGKDVKR